jgi:MraZ protein
MVDKFKMEPNETGAPIYYNSLYRHGVDEKRRVQVPAKWRPAKPGIEFTLMVWPKSNIGPCLRVLPPPKMAELMRDIDAMPKGDTGKGALKRIIGSQSTQVTLDAAGRICLPDDMAKAAGIKDQAVLVGLLDRFEIWSPERHDQVQASDAVLTPEAFKLMD